MVMHLFAKFSSTLLHFQQPPHRFPVNTITKSSLSLCVSLPLFYSSFMNSAHPKTENELAIYYAFAIYYRFLTKVIVYVLTDHVFGQAILRARFCARNVYCLDVVKGASVENKFLVGLKDAKIFCY